jgi:hypothetical protein
MPEARLDSQQRTRARTYVTVIQAAEGYPSDSELRKLEELPAPPVIHAVVLLDDHEKLEAENARLRKALEFIAHHEDDEDASCGDVGCIVAAAEGALRDINAQTGEQT